MRNYVITARIGTIARELCSSIPAGAARSLEEGLETP
jgi:hypothetical protein